MLALVPSDKVVMPLRANTCLVLMTSLEVIGSARTWDKLFAKISISSIDVSRLFSKSYSSLIEVVAAPPSMLPTELSAVFDSLLCIGRSSSS